MTNDSRRTGSLIVILGCILMQLSFVIILLLRPPLKPEVYNELRTVTWGDGPGEYCIIMVTVDADGNTIDVLKKEGE